MPTEKLPNNLPSINVAVLGDFYCEKPVQSNIEFEICHYQHSQLFTFVTSCIYSIANYFKLCSLVDHCIIVLRDGDQVKELKKLQNSMIIINNAKHVRNLIVLNASRISDQVISSIIEENLDRGDLKFTIIYYTSWKFKSFKRLFEKFNANNEILDSDIGELKNWLIELKPNTKYESLIDQPTVCVMISLVIHGWGTMVLLKVESGQISGPIQFYNKSKTIECQPVECSRFDDRAFPIYNEKGRAGQIVFLDFKKYIFESKYQTRIERGFLGDYNEIWKYGSNQRVDSFWAQITIFDREYLKLNNEYAVRVNQNTILCKLVKFEMSKDCDEVLVKFTYISEKRYINLYPFQSTHITTYERLNTAGMCMITRNKHTIICIGKVCKVTYRSMESNNMWIHSDLPLLRVLDNVLTSFTDIEIINS